MWILMVLFVFWLLFMNGLSQVKQWSASGAPKDIVTTIGRGAQRVLATPAAAPADSRPTARVKQPAVPAAPAARPSAAAVVVPQGQPQIATSVPTALPTNVPTAAPAVQAVYTALLDTPTAIPLQACEAGKETFVTSPVTVLNPKGMPIGEARGRSCVSQQEAHDNANKLAQQVMDKDKAAHPEAWR
jgi:hypothetical protein